MAYTSNASPKSTSNQQYALGHNQVSFDQVVEENILRGVLLCQRDALMAVARDPRCSQRHIRVLVEIIARMNEQTGVASPGRAALARATSVLPTGIHDDDTGYTEAVVAKTISELIRFGYLMQDKRAPEGHKRALSNYTIARPSIEDLQAQITDYIMTVRAREPRKIIVQMPADVTIGGNVTYAGNVRMELLTQPDVSGSEITEIPERADVTNVGNVTSVVPAVYNNKINNTLLPAGEGSEAAPSRKRAKKTKPRTELPENWFPTSKEIEWVLQNFHARPQQIQVEGRKFRGHHRGKGSMMANWFAAWQTWWENGFHKIPRRIESLEQLPLEAAQNPDTSIHDAFERRRLADEEEARCRR